jgi:hypothetical protein
MPRTLTLKGIKVVVDNLPKVVDAIYAITDSELLVGVPAEKGTRTDKINNAALAYIHENGSPAANIPARPFMAPGIKNAEKQIIGLLVDGARKALDGNKAAVMAGFHRAGLIAVNSIRKKITDGPFAPLSPRTLAARKRKGFKGTKPLIVTGQLRRSINYVIRSMSQKIDIPRPNPVKGTDTTIKKPPIFGTNADIDKLKRLYTRVRTRGII